MTRFQLSQKEGQLVKAVTDIDQETTNILMDAFRYKAFKQYNKAHYATSKEENEAAFQNWWNQYRTVQEGRLKSAFLYALHGNLGDSAIKHKDLLNKDRLQQIHFGNSEYLWGGLTNAKGNGFSAAAEVGAHLSASAALFGFWL